MKKNLLPVLAMICPLFISAQNIDNKAQNADKLRRGIAEELTWSISRRNYFVPIYIQCDDSSDVQLCLATSWDLFCNYQYRHSISGEDFRQLLKRAIEQCDTLSNICIYDFEYLYGSYRQLRRGVSFVSQENEHNLKCLANNRDYLLKTFFDGWRRFCGDYNILPSVAYRLMEYGILLRYDIDGIYYNDISDKCMGQVEGNLPTPVPMEKDQDKNRI
jgi:hypothetical protein